MTLPEALDHSLSQLRLLSDAASRVEAGGGLLALSVNYAAAAGVMSKDGHRVMERTQKKLTERVKGKDNV